jgi:hypothetical protein
MAVNESARKDFLIQLAGRDRFLSAGDQQPQLDALLQELSSAIDKALDQGRTDLAAVDEGLAKDMAEVGEHLKSSAELLSKAFEETLASSPLDGEALSRLARTVEARILWLYDRVRVRQERSLNQVRPQNRLWKQIVQNVSNALNQVMRNQPEELTLIRDRQNTHEMNGRSIWQVEGPTILEKACARKSWVASRIIYAQMRLRLKRRYQILHPALHDAVNRHRPAMLHPDHEPAGDKYAERHEQVSRSCADLWRGLRFNLETAAEECSRLAVEAGNEEADQVTLRKKLTDTGQLVTETLERAEQQLATLAEPFKELSCQLLEDLKQECGKMLTLIPKDLQRILGWKERLRHQQQRLLRIWRRRYRQWRENLQEPLRRTARPLAFLRQGVERLWPGKERKDKSETMLRSLADLPTPEAILKKAEKLPPVCRRLFTCGALKNREFMVGKNRDLDTLRELFQRWQKGFLCSIAVTGPDGSGKTSLVNCFQSELGNQVPVLRVNFEKRLTDERQLLEICREWFALPDTPADLAAVENHLKNMPRTVIIVEGLHHLVLRTVGGLETGRAFLRLVLASRHHLLWVATIRKYPWQRMEHLVDIDRYFTHQVPTLFNSQAEIRDALLLRLHTSGYPVTFLDDGNLAGKTAASPEKDAQDNRRDRFFSDLFSATRGNMQAALFYWLLNLEFDPEEKVLRVTPFDKLDYGSLKSLERQQLYALAEILAHGGLTAREHAAIFGISPMQSRMLLDYLTQMNLLQYPQAGEDETYYQVNPLFFAPIASLLEAHNIIQ